MRKGIYLILVMISIPIGFVFAQNRERISTMFMTTTLNAGIIFVVAVSAILLFYFVYWLGVRFDLWFRFLGIGKKTTDRLIPQEERIEKVKEFGNKHWLTEKTGEVFNLVDIIPTSHVEGSTQQEAILLTTEKVPHDRRIGIAEIPEDKRYFFVINCVNGTVTTYRPESGLTKEVFEHAEERYKQTVPKEIKEHWLEKLMKGEYAKTIGVKAAEETKEVPKEEKKEE